MTTIKQIQSRIQKLQKQADAIIAKQAQKVVDQIRNLMLEHGLTTSDIENAARKRRQGTALASKDTSDQSGSAGNSKVAVKYRNPKTGETWSGRARPPKWIASVKNRSKFLIDKSEALASSVVKTGAKKRASSKNAGVAQYKDPESGATWTGHGRAPGWIASASDRSVYLIGKAAKTAKKAVEKKAAVKKTAAKKAAVKKTAVKKTAAKKTKANAASKTARKAPTATKRVAVPRKKSAASKTAGALDPQNGAASSTPASNQASAA
ncbi:H-NS family nucleoid-associated regulatory protein [Caballeronia sp. HLA56]